MRARALLLAATVVGALAVPASSAAPASATTGWSRPVPVQAQPALRPATATTVRARLREYTFQTPNIPGGPTYVRVLLPTTYSPSKRYPVLYLLDGCCNEPPQARDWTSPPEHPTAREPRGEAEVITAGRDLITVMPDSGYGGQYTDWVRPGAEGRYQWESYLIGQLVPWIDATFRTRADRSGRAIAGLSMGGFGAMSLAARHPDLFSSATSFSGIVDSNVHPELVTALTALDGGAPDSAFGDRQSEQVLWRGHNPTDLVGNLRSLRLQIFTGNGQSDGSDRPDPVEAEVHDENVSLDAAMTAAGVRHQYDDYGPGTHSWPYWNRSLRKALPGIMLGFSRPSDPSTFTYTSADTHYAIYGYRVRMLRSAREFTTLQDVTSSGFRVSGSGTARVRTAPRYVARGNYTVTTRRPGSVTTRPVTADAQGRLLVVVPLCASNTTDQFSGSTAPRRTCTASVSLTRS